MHFPWRIFATIIALSYAMPRKNVVKTGTTIGPNFQVVQGKQRIECPEKHPYAYHSGKYCCSYPYWDSDPSTNLDIYDDVQRCSKLVHKTCPGINSICKSKDVVEEKLPCLASHPYPVANGAACCSSSTRKSINAPLQSTDPIDECPAHKRVPCHSLPKKRCRLSNPIDGEYTSWSEWHSCTLTCGSGIRQMIRTCTNPAPKYGGTECTGESSITETCNTDPCPVNGEFTAWSIWSSCTKTCGGGSMSRSRTCTNPAPQYGGADCVGDATEMGDCNTDYCPIDGGFSSWSGWADCSRTCGTGTSSRSRTCTNPVPQYGGSNCVGETSEADDCNTDPCPIDGEFSPWTGWDSCTKTCGTGSQDRSRTCTNPAPQHGGLDCVGDATESKDCNTNNCPVNGEYSLWSEWTECSRTCGSGTTSRSRTCTNPAPQFGGSDCTGDSSEAKDCNTDPCPIDGVFSPWTEWDICTKTCETGSQSRSRTCTNPAPQHGGSDCTGDASQTENCNTQPCPVHGEYSEWGAWGSCTKICGGGTASRTRSCDNPAPEHGGDECSGESSETMPCNTMSCCIDGWSVYEPTASCYLYVNTLYVFNDARSNCLSMGGDLTSVSSSGENAYVLGLFPSVYSTWMGHVSGQSTWVDGTTFGTYTNWAPSEPSNPGGCIYFWPNHGLRWDDYPNCVAQFKSVCKMACCEAPIHGKFGEWSDWSTTCSKPCGSGALTRSRSCNNPAPRFGGNDCVGDTIESVECNTGVCCPPGWSFFEDTLSCYTYVATSYNFNAARANCQSMGADLVTIDSADENTHVLSIFPSFSDTWIGYMTGSSTWVDGTPYGAFTYWSPGEPNGSGPCAFWWTHYGLKWDDSHCTLTMNSVCEISDPVNGGFSEWSAWDSCTKACEGGTKNRTRSCTNPAPMLGGNECVGETVESASCNTMSCCPSGWSFYEDEMSCYKYIINPYSFDAARSNCLSLGGDLVTINSADENTHVLGIFPSPANTWIGYVSGSSTWTDGTSFGSYTNWAPGEPKNTGQCTYCWTSYNLQWDDGGCAHALKSVCEKACCT